MRFKIKQLRAYTLFPRLCISFKCFSLSGLGQIKRCFDLTQPMQRNGCNASDVADATTASVLFVAFIVFATSTAYSLCTLR